MAVTWKISTFRTRYRPSPNGITGYMYEDILDRDLQTQEEVRQRLSCHSVLSHYFVTGWDADIQQVVEQLRADFWLIKYPEGEREVQR